MNAQDHDLAHSVAADEPAITAPTSPPRRDPVEDADPTFTRIRPRLDSGSNSIRAMSSEARSPSPAPAAPPAEQQVKMTIRSHPPSSPMHPPEDDGQAVDGAHESAPSPSSDSPVLILDADNDSASPPIEVMDPDDEPGLGCSIPIQIDADEHFRDFPFSTDAVPYHQLVRDLVQHFQGSNALNERVLQDLTLWLNALPDPSADTKDFYEHKAAFWGDFANVINKFVHRRAAFGECFEDDITTQSIVYRFVSAYLRLCSFLLLADIQQLSRPRSEEVYSSVLLSYKHIRLLSILMRAEKAPVFHVLNRDYNADLRELFNLLTKDFLKYSAAQNTLLLLDQIFHHVPLKTQDHYASHASQLLYNLGWILTALPGINTFLARFDYYRHTLSFFEKYSTDIQDPTKSTDANITRDLIVSFSLLLNGLCRWDDAIAAELVDKLVDFGDPESPTMVSSAASRNVDISDYRQNRSCFPALIMNAWRFKTLRKLLVKGNMGLRVMSIASMDTALVDIWREFNNIEPQGRHPVMQFLADFLVQGQVVNYIVSVDSHPQLISRSGNIVGFLVVAHRWSDTQADSIWKAIYTSTDPRVVSATMAMLRTIINLMSPSHHLHLCEKLYTLPIERYNLDILRFLRELSIRLADCSEPVDYTERGLEARPWNVCIRVLRDTAPCRDTDKNSSDLHNEAMDQFMFWTRIIPPDERSVIFRESAQYVAEQGGKATGSVRVITMLASSLHPSDGLFFQENPDIVKSVLEEIPFFVQKQAQSDPYPFLMQALCYRLELLKMASCHAAMTVPSELYETLLDHVIGEKALSNEARDQAWLQFIHATKTAPNNDFCKQVVAHIPKLRSQLYTHGMFDFVASYPFPITSMNVESDQGERVLLQIPGADLLWPMLLSSPPGSIEERTARLLAIRYVKIVDDAKVELVDVEQAHVALVDKCMRELRSAFKALSQSPAARISHDADDNSSIDEARRLAETRVARILLFMKLLLESIRQKPQFNRGRRADSKVDSPEMGIPVGEAITVRYQCGNDRSYVNMGNEHTLDDLYKRLCHATGYTKINLFARGQRLNVSDGDTLRLSDMDLGGQVIVQRAEGAETSRQLSVSSGGSSVFETTVMGHFHELFAWMDSDGIANQLLFEFLSFIPALPTFADSVMREETSTQSLFPPGKVFQARYVAKSLQTRLKEQIHYSALDERFVSKAVHHLINALQDTELIQEDISHAQELFLAAVLTEVLLDFLRERPAPEISAGYFTDGTTFVTRLMTIASIALARTDLIFAAFDAFAAILEASLHSSLVWKAFLSHPGVQNLHTSLLLSQPNQIVREHVGRKILSLCGGDLPSTSPVTRAETSQFFWSVLSMMIPSAVRGGEHSQEFFVVAEQVFHANDEYDRNEATLRAFLQEWTTLLLLHEHHEFVGREEVDHVLLGMTKLLLCCILSLKSFKKPINAGSLMEQAFSKFLFPQSLSSVEDSSKAQPLPILESQTRQELYNLILALAEDRNTYEVLLKLAGNVEHEDREQLCGALVVDRSAEIRSGTGYVGLHNPRAICYLNSLMTQLFMNGDFRQFMLGVNVRQPTGSQRLLAETQRLFAQMQNSYRRAADPRDFAICVKNLDKTPIDITVQMDADEFYNLLFDQWETQLFLPEHKQKFRSFYGGQTLNQIKSMECEHVSERVEPFFAVQCDVQGKANLHESLQAYIQGDVMEGDNKYKCESCDGKFVDAVKRTCLKDVPDNLIFHLKRFEFDLNDFSRRKIYDHFAFEETIDISPYKAEHLADPSKPRQEDIFDLVGVLVHTGTCENGHYYSYIRERPGDNGNSPPTWVEFNDSDVSPFNQAEIADKAFGGFVDVDGYSRQLKQYSAYMLFYQRRAGSKTVENPTLKPANTSGFKAAIPDPLKAEIELGNEHFLREYCLYDPVHTRFVRQLQAASRTVTQGVCSETHEQETQAIHIVLAHLSRIAWRQQHHLETFVELLSQLRRLVLSCTTCCGIALNWIAEDDNAVTNLLIRCCHGKIRAQSRTVLVESLKYLRAQDESQYGATAIEGDMDLDSASASDGVLVSVIQRLRATADDTGEGIRGWDDFYLTLVQVAELGHFEAAMLLNSGFLDFCLRLFCMPKYPAHRQPNPELARIMEKKKGVFNCLVAFTQKLLSYTDLNLPAIADHEGRDRLGSLDRECLKFPLTQTERAIVAHVDPDMSVIAFLDKILEVFDDTKVDHYYPGDIVKWLLETPEHNLFINLCRSMKEGVHMEPPYCDGYIRAALSFCEACASPEHVFSLISRISTIVADPVRMSEDRSPNGEVSLGFFLGLLEAQNDSLFVREHLHAFHAHLMARSCVYGPPLLCHYDGYVRKNSETLFRQLFDNDGHLTDDMLNTKYRWIRELIPELMHGIVSAKKQGQHKKFLIPMINTCRMLVEQLDQLTVSEEPELQVFQDVNDAALIMQYQQEIDSRVRLWLHDDLDTPQSAHEAYDQSDFGMDLPKFPGSGPLFSADGITETDDAYCVPMASPEPTHKRARVSISTNF